MEFKYIVILVCFLFGAFLVYKEVARKDKSRLTWRILASLFMVIAFATLILPISYTVEKEEPLHELNLLTAGTSPDSIKTMATKYVLDSSVYKDNKNLKATFIPDLSYYLANHVDIKKINIYGYGLTPNDLEKLQHYTLTFHPTPLSSGIISCNWPQQIKATQQFDVQGSYQNSTNASVKLILKGFGTNLDSIEVKTNSTSNFTLKTQPKQTGKAIYNLIALQGKDTLSIDPVPFSVTTAAPIQVMMLTAAPGFESRFLKNWLAENQYGVIFRSQISKGKYSSDFLNLKKIDINRVNSAALKNIDVLIIDEEQLTSLAPTERNTIDQQVSNGMGLIINLGDAKKADRYEVSLVAEKPLNLKLASDSNYLSTLPFTQSLFLNPNPNKLSLVTDAAGRILVDRKINGLGQVLQTTLSSTYQWQLAGKKTDYSRFWSALLGAAAKKEQLLQNMQLLPKFTTIGEKSRAIFESNADKIPQLSINGIKLSLRQNMELPFKWDAYFWPNQLGWVELKLNQQITNAFIFGKSDWQTLKNAEQISYTKHFIDNQHQNQTKSEKLTITIEKEVSKWWFFLLFLLTATFLWYELRVLANK